jgi:hypothetical protein
MKDSANNAVLFMIAIFMGFSPFKKFFVSIAAISGGCALDLSQEGTARL